jgi:predicted HTH domain antitoxin
MNGRETKKIVIDMPQDIAVALNESEAHLKKEIKCYLALKFYQQSALTIGKAAALAGMNKADFEIYLAENQTPISMLDFADVTADLHKLHKVKK